MTTLQLNKPFKPTLANALSLFNKTNNRKAVLPALATLDLSTAIKKQASIDKANGTV
jgi:hypothetical protein